VAGSLVTFGFFGVFFSLVLLIVIKGGASARREDVCDPNEQLTGNGLGLGLSLRNQAHHKASIGKSMTDI
jgi:hypothetical protein